MCANVGVDPLTSSKDMWSSLGIGEFYFELAVRTIEVKGITSTVVEMERTSKMRAIESSFFRLVWVWSRSVWPRGS